MSVRAGICESAVTVGKPFLSVVIPCFNEAENLEMLHAALATVFTCDTCFEVEFVLVDDGSTDESPLKMAAMAAADTRVRVVLLPQRVGQTLALWSGLQAACGTWIGHLDGDLQNDPGDLVEMLSQAVADDLDAVMGFRSRRYDDLGRRLASQFANRVRRRVLGDTITDIGCSTRIVRREVLAELTPVANLHRYLPAVLQLGGWRCRQVAAHHRERQCGQSKYGNMSRGLEGMRDLPRISAYIAALKGRQSGAA